MSSCCTRYLFWGFALQRETKSSRPMHRIPWPQEAPRKGFGAGENITALLAYCFFPPGFLVPWFSSFLVGLLFWFSPGGLVVWFSSSFVGCKQESVFFFTTMPRIGSRSPDPKPVGCGIPSTSRFKIKPCQTAEPFGHWGRHLGKQHPNKHQALLSKSKTKRSRFAPTPGTTSQIPDYAC